MSTPIRCEYDSGSALGNRPLCNKLALWDITYSNGSFSSLTIAVCKAHLPNIEARVYPSRTVIEHCTQPWESTPINDTLAASADAIARTERLAGLS